MLIIHYVSIKFYDQILNVSGLRQSGLPHTSNLEAGLSQPRHKKYFEVTTLFIDKPSDC